MSSIFDDSNKVKGNWWKQERVGDKISGTYLGKRQVTNSLKGIDQWIYEIRTEEGEIWNIGGKPGIDIQMRHVKPGQIIGFEFIEERPNPKPGMNATKVVQVYANAEIVDEKFLQGAEAETYHEDAAPARGLTVDQKIEKITKVAREKFNLTDPVLIKDKVMEVTNLAFIESNLDKILEALLK